MRCNYRISLLKILDELVNTKTLSGLGYNLFMSEPQITLIPVTVDNWRHVAALQVSPEQQEFVAEPAYYLCLCHYGGLWQPLAVQLGQEIIGYLQWAVDDHDGSCWLGGIIIDSHQQGKGYGKLAVQAAIKQLSREHGFNHFALSYQPDNTRARKLYLSLGFSETSETEGDEVVARLWIPSNR